jgi:hypothetical protein
VAGVDPPPVLALQHRMGGDERPVLEDADLTGVVLDLDPALLRGVGHGVEIAADRDHAFVAHPALDRQDGVVGPLRRRDQGGLLFGEGLRDDAAGGGVGAGVGDIGAPGVEPGVEIVKVAEGAAEEEVLPDIAERALHLALRLRAVGPARFRRRAVVVEHGDQRGVVAHHPLGVLTDDGGLHAVVEHLGRRAAHGGEGGDVATQDGLQVLTGAEAPPEPAAVPEHHREQPDLARHAGLVGERDGEFGEVHLRLSSRRRLEPPLEALTPGRTNFAQEVGDGGVAALIAHLTDFPQEPPTGKVRILGDPAAQIVGVSVDDAAARRSRAVDWRLHAPVEIFAHRLAVEPGLARDRAHRKPLALQIMDQNDLPKSNHRPPPRHSC